MVQPRETDGFMRALAQFDQDSAKIQSTRALLRSEHERLVEQRRQALERILDEKGLVTCSGFHMNDEAEEGRLGLVSQEDAIMVRSTFGNSMDSHFLIKVLCPQHAPEEPDQYVKNDWYYWGAIQSKVIKVGDRLIQTYDGEDVTHLRIVDGGRPEALYRHFGLSPIPSLPR